MTGENAGLRSCHLRLAVQACGCSAAAALGWGRVWATGGVGVIYIQPRTKIRKNEVVNHTSIYSLSHTQCLWRTAIALLKLVKLHTPHPS
jgi:hypothetical protein